MQDSYWIKNKIKHNTNTFTLHEWNISEESASMSISSNEGYERHEFNFEHGRLHDADKPAKLDQWMELVSIQTVILQQQWISDSCENEEIYFFCIDG